MNIPDCVFGIFSFLSKLYPKEYQRKYSEDLKSVFLDILEDSDHPGGWYAIRSLLIECACLPGCLIREYFSVIQGGRMKSTFQILLVTISGFIALFFLDGLERGMVLGFLGPSYVNRLGVSLLVLIVNGLVSGILAGGVISFALSRKKYLPMMAVCGLGFIAGKVLSLPAFWDILGIPTGRANSDGGIILTYLSSSITGLIVGGLAGLVWKGWKTGLAFGLAGGLIFTLAAVVGTYFYSFLFFDLGMGQIVFSNGINEGLGMPISLVIGRSIFGGIAGILWGILLDRSQRIGSNRLQAV